MKTLFFVQPYVMRRRKLLASGATAFEEAADAVAAGARIARFRPGVVVMSQVVDARTGHMGKPEIIAIHGRVPDAWRDSGHHREAA